MPLAGIALLILICFAGYKCGSEVRSAQKVNRPHSAKLSWVPSVSVVKGYNIYRATQSGGPYRRINPALDPSTVYVDFSVESGMTYYYVTTAVSPGGMESVYSNEVRAVIPPDQQ